MTASSEWHETRNHVTGLEKSISAMKMGYEQECFGRAEKHFMEEWYIRMNLALPNSRVREAIDRLDKYVFNA